MTVTKSSQNNLTSPNGNSLAVFVDISDSTLKLKDINGNIEGFTAYLPPTPLTTGLLQLQGGVALSGTLTAVTDQDNNASQLKLANNLTQIAGTLQIQTDTALYLDVEDGSGNNRFTISREPASQQVNLDFASNPVGSTTMVGAIRTYQDGVNLTETMQFREDGTIFGSGTQASSNFVIQKDITNDLIIYSSATWGGLLTPPTSGGANTMLNGRITGTHGGFGNVAVGLGTVQADGSAYNFNVAMGQGSFARGINCTAIGQGTSAGNSTNVPSNATAIGVGAIALSSNAFALGNASALLQIGGNFTPTARIHVRGLGATSATTSLLVQNSAGNTAFQVKDDLNANFQGRIQIEYDKISFLGSPSNTYIQQALGIGFGYYSAAISNQIMINAQPKIIVKDTGASQASTLIVGHNVATSAAADPSALLEVRSDATYLKGFLPPRMTTAQRDAIVSPATGLKVYNTSTNTTDTYDGATWQRFGQQTLIKGSGSTSATTSLLVQNSAGNRLLETKDDGSLYVGNTASNTGTIFVPYSPTFVDRVFMRIDGGFALFSTVSNALLEISCSQFYTQGNMAMRNMNQGIIGQTAVQTNNSSIQLTTSVNAYNGTNQDDACNLLYIKNNGVTLQAGGSVNFLKLDGTVNEAGGGGVKFCTGIYYNPTLTGGALLANSHYCYHATSGQMMVNTTSPNASAQLQVDSTTRGFLPPRVTTAQKNAIATPANGLMVFDTDLGRPCFYNGAWVTL